jgi:hypothetical protein
MRVRTGVVLSFAASLTLSACIPRTVAITQPVLALQTKNYIVVQTTPDRFVILTRSKEAIDEITRVLGCNKRHMCAGEWSGEMWTISRMK